MWFLAVVASSRTEENARFGVVRIRIVVVFILKIRAISDIMIIMKFEIKFHQIKVW